MKGIIFTELMEMVEMQFSVELAEQIISAAQLPSGGSYTSLGTYSHDEVLQLVTQLSTHTGIHATDLQLAFGEYLFGRFSAVHPEFFVDVSGSFEFLAKVQDYIHMEVRKLYPDATPPKLVCTRIDQRQMQLHYQSHRPFAVVAHGLIIGTGKHFNENLTIDVQLLNDDGTEALFHLVHSD